MIAGLGAAYLFPAVVALFWRIAPMRGRDRWYRGDAPASPLGYCRDWKIPASEGHLNAVG